MSILNTLGGLTSGLGSSGGVGGSIPSNQSSASAAATATINPATTLGDVGSGGYQSIGPFSVNFPGTQILPSNAINAPVQTSAIMPANLISGVALGIALIMLLFIFKNR